MVYVLNPEDGKVEIHKYVSGKIDSRERYIEFTDKYGNRIFYPWSSPYLLMIKEVV